MSDIPKWQDLYDADEEASETGFAPFSPGKYMQDEIDALRQQPVCIYWNATTQNCLEAKPPAPVSKFKFEDHVVKVTGDYRIGGQVRSVFTMANGAVRICVEHKAEGGGSFLHVYGENNLELRP